MKPTTSDADENSPDLLLFRYVEGDLDAAQVQELEARLASDAALRDELAFWKESFAEPEAYDTAHLDQSLLVPVARRWTGSFFGSWYIYIDTDGNAVPAGAGGDGNPDRMGTCSGDHSGRDRYSHRSRKFRRTNHSEPDYPYTRFAPEETNGRSNRGGA